MAILLLTPALTVYEHMALDELLARGPVTEPVLRIYHWVAGPAVTFGYAQFYELVCRQTCPAQGPLCRRPTGGGIVSHGEDITFSVIFQSKELRPKVIYAQLHGAIEQAILQAGALQPCRQGKVAAQMYAPQRQGIANGCFANPVEDDLLFNGQKILGGAIRRFGTVVLYQGSLQCLQARTNSGLRQAIKQGVAEFCTETFVTSEVDDKVLLSARKLATSQYQTESWMKKFI